MTVIDAQVALAAQSSFGRDGAMFESLLGFVAQLSVVLWGLVVLTAAIRFVGVRIYGRAAARASRTAKTTAPATTVAGAATRGPSGLERLEGPRRRHAEPRTGTRVPALANDSVEA